jgi:hypothetical protein
MTAMMKRTARTPARKPVSKMSMTVRASHLASSQARISLFLATGAICLESASGDCKGAAAGHRDASGVAVGEGEESGVVHAVSGGADAVEGDVIEVHVVELGNFLNCAFHLLGTVSQLLPWSNSAIADYIPVARLC